MHAGRMLVEDFGGPPAIGLGAQRQIAVKGLQEQRVVAPHIGNHLVRVRRHQARGMNQHAMQLRRVGEAVPVRLLHLTRLVRMQEEVAARGAPAQRQGGCGIDDAGSGHVVSTRRAPCQHCAHSFQELRAISLAVSPHAVGGRRFTKPQRNSARACSVWGDLGTIFPRSCFESPIDGLYGRLALRSLASLPHVTIRQRACVLGTTTGYLRLVLTSPLKMRPMG